jgi:antitoxin component YwqK of YwqJK toxin-antitoxin module
MTVPAPPRRRVACVPLLAVLFSGCQDPTLSKKSPPPYLLVEKGPYQSLYGPDGRIERLVYDRNGDRVADAVILYDPDGKVRRAEIDTDLDQIIDRWEYFENGVLVRVGFTRSRRSEPDYWEVVAPDGSIIRREYDDDGDGKVDRTEPPG